MPFIPQNEREEIAKDGVAKNVGGMCYIEYKKLMQAWGTERRWTTAHNEFKRLFDCDDIQASKALAYFVFFCNEVMLYEEEKRRDNGDI